MCQPSSQAKYNSLECYYSSKRKTLLGWRVSFRNAAFTKVQSAEILPRFLVSVGMKLIFFLIVGIELWFGFGMREWGLWHADVAKQWLRTPASHAVLPENNQGMHKMLGGVTAWITHPNWSRGYSIQYHALLSIWSREKDAWGAQESAGHLLVGYE